MSYETDIVQAVAARVARRYAQRCWWADEGDLRQEAITAGLDAIIPGQWDAAVGVPLQAYVWRACVLHVRAYLWRNSSPMSETHENLRGLKGVHRSNLDEGIVDQATRVDALLDSCRWIARAREQIEFVLSKAYGDKAAAVAVRMLLEETPPRELAVEVGLPVARVYRITQRARALLGENLALCKMVEELRA